MFRCAAVLACLEIFLYSLQDARNPGRAWQRFRIVEKLLWYYCSTCADQLWIKSKSDSLIRVCVHLHLSAIVKNKCHVIETYNRKFYYIIHITVFMLRYERWAVDAFPPKTSILKTSLIVLVSLPVNVIYVLSVKVDYPCSGHSLLALRTHREAVSSNFIHADHEMRCQMATVTHGKLVSPTCSI